MRRFEFVEAKSSKYWQIALDGSAVELGWGRLGTAGQSKTKRFDSAAAARAEHDKLVAEKTKKGYLEVTRGETAAAATETAHAAPRVVWSDNLRAQVAPRFGGVGPAEASGGGESERFDRLKAGFAKVSTRWNAAQAEPEVAKWMAAAATWVEAPAPGPLDLDVQATLAIMLGVGGSEWYGPRTAAAHHQMVTDLIGVWWHLGGPAFAVTALLRVGLLGPFATYWTLTLQGPPVGPVYVAGDVRTSYAADAWRELARLLALHDEGVYQAARAVLAEVWSGASFNNRALALTAFPMETSWAADLGATWLAHIEDWSQTTGYVRVPLTCRYPTEMGVAVMMMLAVTLGRRNEIRGQAATLLDRYGVEAAPLLEIGLERAEWDETARDAAEALAAIRTGAVARRCAGWLDKRVLRPLAVAFFEAEPELAVPALAGVLAHRGKAAEPAGVVLVSLDRAHPGLLDRHLEALPTAARNAVAALRERLHVPPEAPLEALPAILVNPPWESKQKPTEPRVVATGAPLPYEERIEWQPRERDRARQVLARWRHTRFDFAKLDALARAGKPVDPHGYPGQALFHLANLSDDEALRAWLTWPAAEFRLTNPGVLTGHLARHGLDVLPGFLALARLNSSGVAAELVRVRSPRVGPLMAKLLSGKAAKRHAEAWLLADPELAAVSLVPAAVGPVGAERSLAQAALRWLAGRGHRAAVEGVGARYGAEAAAEVMRVLDTDPRALVPTRLPKLPSFCDPRALPRPRLRGPELALPLWAVEHLATMLAFSPPDEPYAGLEDVVDACDPASLEAFAWGLFQAWLLDGAPSKQSWVMTALGVLGGDDVARRLTPLIRAWPGEKAQARAVLGLEVLARIGTDTALMHLHGIALKLRYKVLQQRAAEKVDEIADARGFTPEELADRLVPDLDLDPDGSRTLDFGPRQFRVGFDESLAPVVRETSGNLLRDLPRPGKSDDADLAKAAVELWKALKKDARAVASTQVVRLELAMCRRRRWTGHDLRAFFIDHPLVVHLARRLIWGVYASDANASLTDTFRVAEDGTLASVADDPFELPVDACVGIPHRLELEAVAETWGALLADYLVLQPFPQLGREVYTLTAEEARQTVLHHVEGATVPTGRVLGLDHRGWRRGDAMDSGAVWTYDKPLGGGLTAHLWLDPGLFAARVDSDPEQTLGEITVSSEGEQAVPPLGELDPVALSELLRDAHLLRSGA